MPHEAATTGAIILGGNYRALGAVRSLGRRGIPVFVIRDPGDYLAEFSRYTRRTLIWPSEDPRERVDFLSRIASRYGLRGTVVIPTDDAGAELLAKHYESLAGVFSLASAPWETLRWAHDKRLTYAVAREIGVDIPWTVYPRSREDVLALECRFPVILKPAYKEELNRFTSAKAWRIDDRDSLLARFDEACTLVPPESLMIQELLSGGGETQFSFAAIARDGVPLASVIARRVRQYPMDFGKFSTYVESITDPGIVEPATRLIRRLGYTGILEIEFKRDGDLFKLLDINPRIFGWHTLCGRAGVDMPYLLWLLASGREVPHIKGIPDMRWIWLNSDLQIIFKELLGGRITPRDYLRSFRPPLEHAISASDDLLPGLLELPLIAVKMLRQALTGLKHPRRRQ